MRWINARYMLTIWILVVGTSLSARPAMAEPVASVQMSQVTGQLLEAMLSGEQVSQIHQTLRAAGQESLGPMPVSADQFAGPDRVIRLEAAAIAADHGLPGDGSAEQPFEDVLDAFFREYDGQPATVLLSGGHYIEAGVNVPEGVWLRSDPQSPAHLHAPTQWPDDTPHHILSVGSGSGVVGLHMDAGQLRFDWEPRDYKGRPLPHPTVRISAIVVREDADQVVVAANRIRRIPGAGVTGLQNSGNVLITSNELEFIGYAGIRASRFEGSDAWRVEHNTIRYAGILRATGGRGDDGIIFAFSVGGQMTSNLLVASRQWTSYGRHAAALHVADQCLIAGNLIILEDQVRGGLRFSDGSHHNQFVGNVILSIPEDDGTRPTREAIGGGGQGNAFLGNVAIGTRYALHIRSNADDSPSQVRLNYHERTHSRASLSTRGPLGQDDHDYADNQSVGLTHVPVLPYELPTDMPQWWQPPRNGQTSSE